MATSDKPRACAGTTKTGNPCKANPLKGTDRCLAHSDPETRESVGFVADNGKGGRPRVPKVTEVLLEKVEEEAEKITAALFEALQADQGVALQIKGGGMDLALIPDHRTRLQAANALLDRVYGRPKQQTELTGKDDGPVEMVSIVPLDAEQRSARAAELLKRHGHA